MGGDVYLRQFLQQFEGTGLLWVVVGLIVVTFGPGRCAGMAAVVAQCFDDVTR